MGHVYVNVLIGNPKGRTRRRVRMMVDTGATYTVVPAALAKELGLPDLGEERVRLADETLRNLPRTAMAVRINGRSAGTIALVVPKGDPLLGVETLEALGLGVDPARRRLVPTRPFAVRLGFGRRPRRKGR